jgi:hypothetical protein
VTALIVKAFDVTSAEGWFFTGFAKMGDIAELL